MPPVSVMRAPASMPSWTMAAMSAGGGLVALSGLSVLTMVRNFIGTSVVGRESDEREGGISTDTSCAAFLDVITGLVPVNHAWGEMDCPDKPGNDERRLICRGG